MTELEWLKQRKLVKGRGAWRGVLRACHAGRLVGGLSVSLRALPDEVAGTLMHALGGAATGLRVTDVRTGAPMVLEVEWREVHEKWETADVEALVHNCNDLFRAEPDVRVAAVLGEWEDMLQLWCVPKSDLGPLLDRRLLDEARNLRTLRGIHEGSNEPRDDDW